MAKGIQCFVLVGPKSNAHSQGCLGGQVSYTWGCRGEGTHTSGWLSKKRRMGFDQATAIDFYLRE